MEPAHWGFLIAAGELMQDPLFVDSCGVADPGKVI